MTSEQFLAILQQFKFKLKHAPYLVPDTSADTIQRWADGREAIPTAVADRLRHLSVAFEVLKLQAIEEAQAAEKTIFWPSYLHAADFKAIDPLQYETFLGSPWAYSTALNHAEVAFVSMRLKGSKIKGYVQTYCFTARAYFTWLQHHGLPNTETNRRQFAEECHERNRPPTGAEFTAQMQELLTSPTTSATKRRFASDMLGLQKAAELKDQAYRRQRDALKPRIPSPDKVVEDFFVSRANV